MDIVEKCLDSAFGCCADGKAKATGPGNEGCPEYTKPNIVNKKQRKQVRCFETKCGCCPDGETVALGPNYQGCEMKRPALPKGKCHIVVLSIGIKISVFRAQVFNIIVNLITCLLTKNAVTL